MEAARQRVPRRGGLDRCWVLWHDYLFWARAPLELMRRARRESRAAESPGHVVLGVCLSLSFWFSATAHALCSVGADGHTWSAAVHRSAHS